MAEVVAFEQQRLSGVGGQCVGETVPKVKSRPTAEVPVGGPRDRRLGRCQFGDLHRPLRHEAVQQPGYRGVFPAVNHDPEFHVGCRGHLHVGGRAQGAVVVLPPVLGVEHRDDS